jgi:hypothetical protein
LPPAKPVEGFPDFGEPVCPEELPRAVSEALTHHRQSPEQLIRGKGLIALFQPFEEPQAPVGLPGHQGRERREVDELRVGRVLAQRLFGYGQRRVGDAALQRFIDTPQPGFGFQGPALQSERGQAETGVGSAGLRPAERDCQPCV